MHAFTYAQVGLTDRIFSRIQSRESCSVSHSSFGLDLNQVVHVVCVYARMYMRIHVICVYVCVCVRARVRLCVCVLVSNCIFSLDLN